MLSDIRRELAGAVNETLKPVRPLESPPASRRSDSSPPSLRGGGLPIRM